MRSRLTRNGAGALLAAILALTGCDGAEQPVAPPSASPSELVDEPALVGSDGAADEPRAPASDDAVASDLDFGALDDRQDPERLLRFHASAVRARDWVSATRAWALDAQMTPEALARLLGGENGPRLALGKGDATSAAGTLFYEAPLVVDFADGRPALRGTIVLRRANDVPGASVQQLDWRIERIALAPGT